MAKPRRGLLELRVIALPLSFLLWTADVLIVILWTPIMAVFRIATRRSDPGRNRVGRLLRNSAVLAVRINPFWDFHAIDPIHPNANRPYLFVSNHRSLADVFLLCLLPWDMKFLSKESVFRIPLLGWQMRVAGDIELSRGDKESARRALEQMRERLLQKSSVVVFPEGTRSADGSLAPFRDGAFRLAIELSVDVMPLAIWGTEAALPKHSLTFRKTTATVTVLPPVSTAGLSPADAPRLAERVRGEIEHALEKAGGRGNAIR
ncbi:MAG TPA: lysophospholipid acyltransferase family protein [Thermoanaerobaculia bacterium]